MKYITFLLLTFSASLCSMDDKHTQSLNPVKQYLELHKVYTKSPNPHIFAAMNALRPTLPPRTSVNLTQSAPETHAKKPSQHFLELEKETNDIIEEHVSPRTIPHETIIKPIIKTIDSDRTHNYGQLKYAGLLSAVSAFGICMYMYNYKRYSNKVV